MSRLSVSLIVPTHRPRLGVLHEVLAAAIAQLVKGDEAIVVENGPPTLAGALPPGIRIVHEPRLGSAFARQRGVAGSRGEVIWFLDDDTVPVPGHLTAGLDRLGAHPRLGILGGAVTVVDEQGVPPPSRVARELFGERALGPDFQITSPGHRLLPAFMPFSAGALFRRPAAQAHFADLDPAFPGRVGATGVDGCEDVEMVATALATGWQVGFEPGMHVRHIIDPRRFAYRSLARLSFGSARSYGRFLVKHGHETPISRLGAALRAFRGLLIRPPLGPERGLRYLQYVGRAAGRTR